MSSSEILSTYIKKLRHPLKEIRERALQLLLAKLRLGWELEDELIGTRDLFESLLTWFQDPEPTLQKQALSLLLSTIKSKSGTYIAKEHGIKELLAKLTGFCPKIDSSALEVFDDLLDTLRFLNTVESQEDVRDSIPQLNLPSANASESDRSSSAGYYNVDPNGHTSTETSVSNSASEIHRSKDTETPDGIKLLLFPWVDLCTSDIKTMLLIENALRVLKSTRRCCRFIRDVFLRDFPAEIFLNRPNIVQNLLAVIGGTNSGKLAEPLHVLLCITKELCVRIRKISCLELVHETEKIYDTTIETEDQVNIDLEQFASEPGSTCLKSDGLEALRQLPAPIYALEALQTILTTLARSFVMIEPNEGSEVLDLNELNLSLALVKKLINLFLNCVDVTFWSVEHKTKTHRDIAHKSTMVMRLMGDLLDKYRKSSLSDPDRRHHRISWLRLAEGGCALLRWAAPSALSLQCLQDPLKYVQLDQAVGLYYPELVESVGEILENNKTSIDKEYITKYKELTKLFQSMTKFVKFTKNRDNCKESKEVLTCIKDALPVLDLHMNEGFVKDIGHLIFEKTRVWEMDDSDWSICRSICLTLMSHSSEQVRAIFYAMLAEMVKSCLVGEDDYQVNNEKGLYLLCDVGMLTEICCHGLCDSSDEVTSPAMEIMLYLLRGRLVLSERCWWRLLACLLPILPLLHVYVAPDSYLGKAISKSLEADIAECMGVPASERLLGLARLLYVRCAPAQADAAHEICHILECMGVPAGERLLGLARLLYVRCAPAQAHAAHEICHILDDPKYLPPKESLRADVLLSAMRRVKPQDFNVDITKYSTKPVQTTALSQILDVLKQDIELDESQQSNTSFSRQPTLEPSLRLATLQQLSVLLRDPALHDAFVALEGVTVVGAILRMSLLIDDYLAFPNCAISCVSVLNSICFGSRHALAKIADLPALLLRVILIFPGDDASVLMSSQVLAMIAWSGFALLELGQDRRRVVSLPASVVSRTSLPFYCSSYWSTSPNTQHSTIEWLQSSEEWRTAIRTRWAHSWGPPLAPPPPGPLTLRLTRTEQALLRATSPMNACGAILMGLQGASSHKDVHQALALLEGYSTLIPSSSEVSSVSSLPWTTTLCRFLSSPPASQRDVALLISLLKFVAAYMNNVPNRDGALDWIKTSFLDDKNSIISLLSRDQLFPGQDNAEVSQLHIHIVKVVLRCVNLEYCKESRGDGSLEILLKIMLCCLEVIDLKNFHALGYLNELTCSVRYILNAPSSFSEQTLVETILGLARVLRGGAAGGGRKGQRCRLDALLAILAVLKRVAEMDVPFQRWSEPLCADVIKAVVCGARAPRAELRAVALLVAAELARHAAMLPQLLHAIEEESLSQYASGIFSQRSEASVVRAAAAALLTSLTARAQPHSDVFECDIMQQLSENNFMEHCIDILLEFSKEQIYKSCLEPNIPLSVLERRSQLEVRAQKCPQVQVSPCFISPSYRPPTASLVAGLCDVVYNVVGFGSCPVQAWNELGLFRLMFKCAFWTNGTVSEVCQVRASTCRALARVADGHKKVRSTLANTKDCLYNLLMSLTPLDEDSDAATISARAQTLQLLASLAPERAAADAIWAELTQHSQPFFMLLLQCLEFDGSELQEAGMYCLSQLAHSASNKKSSSKLDFLDKLKSPYYEKVPKSSGDGDCQPEYLVEEICKLLMGIYQKSAVEKKKFQCSTDDIWARTCACLSSMFALSPRARDYGVHREFPRTLLATLQGIRDRLTLAGKTAEIIRNANNNPVLRCLHWLLILSTNLMMNCPPAKESFASLGLAPSLCRMWPWCMMTEDLRHVVLDLLVVFSNDCRKAWSSMSSCVGGRSVIAELSALCVREAALVARTRPERALTAALRALAHAVHDNHARAQLIKNGALNSVYKIRVAERSWRGREAAAAWARLAEAVARHADGAASLLELRHALAANHARGLILTAVAHAAHFHRAAFLQADPLLELVSAALLGGEPAEQVAGARAAWALAANNHKAKLTLRSAGVSSAVFSALERLQRSRRDAETDKALQLLTYTNTVLQTD